jgi:hypothetical protein
MVRVDAPFFPAQVVNRQSCWDFPAKQQIGVPVGFHRDRRLLADHEVPVPPCDGAVPNPTVLALGDFAPEANFRRVRFRRDESTGSPQTHVVHLAQTAAHDEFAAAANGADCAHYKSISSRSYRVKVRL